MAEGSEQVSFKKYGVKPVCAGCGRTVKRAEPLWFRGWPLPTAVYGKCCFKEAP